ncbi:hypothetical protein KFE25_010132 [Diacronema lutheri]|uniref:AAA+ ATPase domain-containing protein n=1 Tax=Diacronema lutheri TaxID=2081491 RepID=A0A8J5XQC7_DIALT|nr:hypothetical protein KFE25_010132 [Diacronema lutheri]
MAARVVRLAVVWPLLTCAQAPALVPSETLWQMLPTMHQALCSFSSGLCAEDGCPWRADWAAAAEDALGARVRHQPAALHLVLDALRLHYGEGGASQRAARAKPLVFSFHGPTGVGKSLLHEVLARALYERADARGRAAGALVIGAVGYRNAALALEYEEELRARINQHVRRCARPLIVVEELQLMPPSALRVLVPMLSRPTDSSAPDYSNATFVLTSNLGGEAVIARAYAAPSREQLDLDALQDELLATVDIAAGSTALSAAVDVIVPFLPFGRAELGAEARAMLAQLRADVAPAFAQGAGLEWDAGAGPLLLDKLAWEGDHEQAERQLARYGLQTLATKFNMLVSGPVRRHVDATLRRACGEGGASGRLATSVCVVVVHADSADGARGGDGGSGGLARLAVVDCATSMTLDAASVAALRGGWWMHVGPPAAEPPRCARGEASGT